MLMLLNANLKSSSVGADGITSGNETSSLSVLVVHHFIIYGRSQESNLVKCSCSFISLFKNRGFKGQLEQEDAFFEQGTLVRNEDILGHFLHMVPIEESAARSNKLDVQF